MVRRRLLRHLPSRGRDPGPAAPGVPRSRVARARTRGVRPGNLRAGDRRLRRLRHEHVPHVQPGAQPGDPRTVQPYQLTMANDKDYLPTRVAYKFNLRGPADQRADGLLHIARRDAPGLPGAAEPRLRHGAGRRGHDPPAAKGRLPLPGGRHRVARRPLPRVRRGRRRHGGRQRRGRGRPQARRGRASPTATRSTRSSRAARSTTTARTRSGTPRPAWKGQTQVLSAAYAVAGSTRRTFRTSRPTARARRSAIRSRSRRLTPGVRRRGRAGNRSRSARSRRTWATWTQPRASPG